MTLEQILEALQVRPRHAGHFTAWRAFPPTEARYEKFPPDLDPRLALALQGQRIAQLYLQTQLNAAIRARAAQRSDLHYIDVVPLMLDNGVPRDIFLQDGLHMTRDGYVLWTAAVKAALLPDDAAELRSCEQREAGRPEDPQHPEVRVQS